MANRKVLKTFKEKPGEDRPDAQKAWEAFEREGDDFTELYDYGDGYFGADCMASGYRIATIYHRNGYFTAGFPSSEDDENSVP